MFQTYFKILKQKSVLCLVGHINLLFPQPRGYSYVTQFKITLLLLLVFHDILELRHNIPFYIVKQSQSK